ncbi:Na+ antiporter [Desulfosporosinus orientis DSM 765]|uniref:Na+ antiporter n=1 Tax=Desulfosporosinus orientis (strain ATCC 19365 / DSM 765 / NCIMB 8382 / VKM B-1628 / Singapore I) TaxID=768706 RepID=G7W8H1_DESOD|nr:Na+/H+ antiporter [Desulfosporosinus orientis]AET67111.1 Na+ antiporter [Desulfosporosinus orientis DSM 765]
MHSLSFFWLLLLTSIVAMLGRFIKIPYTIALVLTGLVVGYFGLLPGVYLEPHILFAIFLPPLLFEAGINIHLRPLRHQWKIIGVLAVLGTIISTVFVGYGMHLLLGMPILVALLFGAVISPTDPISVLALFKRLGVNERLSVIVEAESLFNDGIAVVLYGVVQGVVITSTISLTNSILSFFMTVCGGAAIGILVGWIASRITREFDDHLLEITLTTVVAYGSYLAAEGAHVSGVIAVVAASLVVGNYGLPKGMTPASRLAVLSFWEYAAFAVNSVVFLLVGLEITLMPVVASIGTVVAAFGVVLAGRLISVYSSSAVLSVFKQHIPSKWRYILVWGGLRGALSMAMVLGISTSIPERNYLVSLIFGVVLISLVGQGLSIEKLVTKLGLSGKKSNLADYQLLLGENLSLRRAEEELERNVNLGAISQSTFNKITQRIGIRQQEIEREITKLHQVDDRIAADEMKKAERIVLLAQKNAFQNAARNEVIEWNVAANLMSRVEEERSRDSQENHG